MELGILKIAKMNKMCEEGKRKNKKNKNYNWQSLVNSYQKEEMRQGEKTPDRICT